MKFEVELRVATRNAIAGNAFSYSESVVGDLQEEVVDFGRTRRVVFLDLMIWMISIPFACALIVY